MHAEIVINCVGRKEEGDTQWAVCVIALRFPLCLTFVLDHPTLEPRHFVDEKVVNEHYPDYMFLECIKFINEVRRRVK